MIKRATEASLHFAHVLIRPSSPPFTGDAETVDKLRQKRIFKVELDAVTKIMLILFITAVSYFAFLTLLSALFYNQPQSMHEMMHFNQYTLFLNLGSLSLALGVGLLFSLLVKTKTRMTDELRIIKKALSEDEKAIIDEARRAWQNHSGLA